MGFSESLDAAFETLFEDVESRMHHLLQIILGKKSRWPEKDKPNAEELAKEYLRQIAQFDPTQGKTYMQFLVKQVAANQIRLPEDGPPLKETLETFMNGSRKKEWKGERDIMRYAHWRDLQKACMEYAKEAESKTVPSSETAWVNKAKEGSERIVDVDVKTKTGLTNYVVVKVSTPIAVTVYGRGTQWCTSCSLFKTVKSNELEGVIEQLTKGGDRYRGEKVEGDPWANLTPEQVKQYILELNGGDLNKKELKVPNTYYHSALSNAKNYLQGGPMFIIFKNGAPYIQMTNSGRELRNIEDSSLKTTSSALGVVFREMVGEPQPREIEELITRKGARPQAFPELKKTLLDHIKRGEAFRARAAQQQQRPPQ